MARNLHNRDWEGLIRLLVLLRDPRNIEKLGILVEELAPHVREELYALMRQVEGMDMVELATNLRTQMDIAENFLLAKDFAEPNDAANSTIDDMSVTSNISLEKDLTIKQQEYQLPVESSLTTKAENRGVWAFLLRERDRLESQKSMLLRLDPDKYLPSYERVLDALNNVRSSLEVVETALAAKRITDNTTYLNRNDTLAEEDAATVTDGYQNNTAVAETDDDRVSNELYTFEDGNSVFFVPFDLHTHQM